MSNNTEAQVKTAMQAGVDHFKQELKALRTGRANAAMLDKVFVEAYGSKVPLKQVASISVPEARQILVSPFDASTVNSIVKGIEAANLGINPHVDGKVIRVNVPPMDESIRKGMVKQCKDLAEKAKVSLREVRRKYNDIVRKEKADGVISEDVMKKDEKKIQELTDRFCKEVDTVGAEKEKEIMTV